MFIAKFFGSKRLAATVGSILAVLLVPVANAKLGLHLDPTQVAEVIGAVLLAGITYVSSQWHLDVKTEGDTTSSSLLKAAVQPSTPQVPAEFAAALAVLAGLAKPGSALAEALKSVPVKPADPKP